MAESHILRLGRVQAREQPVVDGATSGAPNGCVVGNGVEQCAYTENVESAFQQLHEAYACAAAFGVSRWEFAVDIADLRTAGIQANSLRYLICAGLVEHAQEVVTHSEKGRQFVFISGLTFSETSCFVLTSAGEKAACAAIPAGCGRAFAQQQDSVTAGVISQNERFLRPHWDHERHELKVGSCVVKRFKSPALNQEIILMAFEEEKWPSRIDDPLPPVPELDPRRRLHDAIKCLNRHQVVHLLHFRGDGTGEGVIWENVHPK